MATNTSTQALCTAIDKVEKLVKHRLESSRMTETQVVDWKIKHLLDYLEKQIDTRTPTFLENIVRNARQEMEARLPQGMDYAKSIEKLEIMQEKWMLVRFGEYWSQGAHHDILYGTTEPEEWMRPGIGPDEHPEATRRIYHGHGIPDVERVADAHHRNRNDTVRGLRHAQIAFECCSWAKIYQILEKERHLVNIWESEASSQGTRSLSPTMPMHQFLTIISTFMLEWNFQDVYEIIQEFVTANMVQHPWTLSHIDVPLTRQELALNCNIHGLAEQLQRDTENLCKIPAKFWVMEGQIEQRIRIIEEHNCLYSDSDSDYSDGEG
ncbi:hypothetical protein CONLIGDRAFT_708854 [Coniochaeta ligniaria NRRL 30616]|uniref:Uncharacterized protein n=1 Tax=Coniochaeta ligniaria NRRL 30616 TaxID=1408157 RepID=A0A1J7IE35_9PEZI|nr:hypothetical protein CONLIGDRAFT_708854 [Coniochaeta ligniaria NRRL 30616]